MFLLIIFKAWCASGYIEVDEDKSLELLNRKAHYIFDTEGDATLKFAL